LKSESDHPRVVTYVNIRLILLQFALCRDVINHRDLLLILFFNNNNILWLLNVYSNSSHTALKYLKDTKFNIQNLLIMTGDFNICDNLWDSLFPHYSSISDNLFIIADSFNLELSNPTDQVPTQYSDNEHDSNSVIDLMFLHSGSSELDNHSIYSNWRLSSNHASLTIIISITEEHTISSKHSIIKDSEEEPTFIKDLTNSIRNINTSNISDIASINRAANKFASMVEVTWGKNLKVVNITRHSKS